MRMRIGHLHSRVTLGEWLILPHVVNKSITFCQCVS
jgi:hypothetical protein